MAWPGIGGWYGHKAKPPWLVGGKTTAHGHIYIYIYTYVYMEKHIVAMAPTHRAHVTAVYMPCHGTFVWILLLLVPLGPSRPQRWSFPFGFLCHPPTTLLPLWPCLPSTYMLVYVHGHTFKGLDLRWHLWQNKGNELTLDHPCLAFSRALHVLRPLCALYGGPRATLWWTLDDKLWMPNE